MTRQQLADHLAAHLPRTTPAIHNAILAIHDGSTWRAAAIAHGVTESGILKAMQRAGLRKSPAIKSTLLTYESN